MPVSQTRLAIPIPVSTVLLEQGEDMVVLLTGMSGEELAQLSEDGPPTQDKHKTRYTPNFLQETSST